MNVFLPTRCSTQLSRMIRPVVYFGFSSRCLGLQVDAPLCVRVLGEHKGAHGCCLDRCGSGGVLISDDVHRRVAPVSTAADWRLQSLPSVNCWFGPPSPCLPTSSNPKWGNILHVDYGLRWSSPQLFENSIDGLCRFRPERHSMVGPASPSKAELAPTQMMAYGSTVNGAPPLYTCVVSLYFMIYGSDPPRGTSSSCSFRSHAWPVHVSCSFTRTCHAVLLLVAYHNIRVHISFSNFCCLEAIQLTSYSVLCYT
jgi:hypothetical protein